MERLEGNLSRIHPHDDSIRQGGRKSVFQVTNSRHSSSLRENGIHINVEGVEPDGAIGVPTEWLFDIPMIGIFIGEKDYQSLLEDNLLLGGQIRVSVELRGPPGRREFDLLSHPTDEGL